MNSLQKQHGMGLINLVLVVLICGFCGTFAFKVVPMYAENRYIVAGLKSLVEPGMNFEQMSDAEINKKMNNFYMVNNVRSQDGKKIDISRSSNRLVVKVDYEARSNLFANIDVVMSFKNHLDSARPNECCNPLDDTSVKSKY
ncbi:MAG: DUF4845 domain-containing protein [Pseudomonadota bacterium]